jgi:Ca2+-binding RTX toxin-like protein
VIANLFESLESRQLLSSTAGTAFIKNDRLEIVGESRVNTVVTIVTLEGSDDAPPALQVTINGRVSTFDLEEFNEILYRGGRRNDTVTINEDNGPIARTIRLYGNDGNDRLTADVSPVALFGGNGRDILLGSFSSDVLFGGNGDDDLFGDDGNDDIAGGKGDDDIRGDGGNDFLRGDADDDRIDGGLGSDDLRGDRGDDILIDRAQFGEVNTFTGGRGWDTFFVSRPDRIRDLEWGEDVFVANNNSRH